LLQIDTTAIAARDSSIVIRVTSVEHWKYHSRDSSCGLLAEKALSIWVSNPDADSPGSYSVSKLSVAIVRQSLRFLK